MLARYRKVIAEFPRTFWVVVITSFIDGVGGTLLFPFFALYITERFAVGMATAGVLLGLSSLFGLAGSMLGGALTDRFGRRRLILFGLIFSALSALAFGLVSSLSLLYPVIAVVGLLSSVAHPAHNAMVADLLPEEKRQEGFGILRVVGNLAWIIGPSIGGFVAARSFFALFVIDATVSCVVAAIVFRLIPETRPRHLETAHGQSLVETFRGYAAVSRDRAFMAFLAASILMLIVYQQMYNSLSVYLRDSHGINPRGYGLLLTTSAIVVVLLQFWVSRRIKIRPPFLMMVVGALFYMVGFGMFGVVATYPLFLLAIIIVTVGEMIVVPTSQALAAHFAPEEMRGRYMAAFGLSWTIPATLGPGVAGYILDHFNPNLLWLGGGVLCLASAISFLALHTRLGLQPQFAGRLSEASTEA